MYTVKELIELLQDYPSGLEVQIDCEGAWYDEVSIDRVGKKLVITTQGEPDF